MKSFYFIKMLFFVSLVFVFSCKKSSKIIHKSITTTSGQLPIIVPSDSNFAPLSSNYISSKKGQIKNFYNLNWAGNTMNGSFLVAQNGIVIFEKYNGFANLESHKLINAKTPIHTASVSKVITATAILLLVDAKKLDLDQNLTSILPNFPYQNISIRNLLSHRSGLKNYAYFTNKREIWNPDIILTNDDLLEILSKSKMELDFMPNKKFCYSNTNYALLALVIEKITGLKYPDAIKKMIFEPLQMNNSYVFEINKHQKLATPSYKWNGQKYATDYLDGIYGDKNIYATPRDLLQLDLARHSNHFLNADLVQQMYSGYSYEHYGTKNYGLGIRMIEWDNGQKFYFHNGWWHGNTSSYISLGKENLTIIALSNKFNRNTYKVKRVASIFGDYPFKVTDTI